MLRLSALLLALATAGLACNAKYTPSSTTVVTNANEPTGPWATRPDCAPQQPDVCDTQRYQAVCHADTVTGCNVCQCELR